MNRLRLTPKGLLFQGRTLPCVVGRGGVRVDKREGDGATPAGIHHVVGCLYRPDRVSKPNRWAEQILPGDLWSDDENDSDYNHLVRAPYTPSHEVLRRADPMYDVVLVLDWNWPNAVPCLGSAIFIHQWRRQGFPTAGCLALARGDLLWLARHMQFGAQIDVSAIRLPSVCKTYGNLPDA
ncbi:MAG: L,D-transpeptidase family protein [Deltaproteobacteria bacterium]